MNQDNINRTFISEKIKQLRDKSLKRKKLNKELLNIPVAYWVKEDR